MQGNEEGAPLAQLVGALVERENLSEVHEEKIVTQDRRAIVASRDVRLVSVSLPRG